MNCEHDTIANLDTDVWECDWCGLAFAPKKEYAESERAKALREQWKRLDGFCRANGGREVHRSWRDNMLMQERDVSDERMNWDTLPYLDKELDAKIAKEVIEDFLVWAMGTALMEADGS